MSDTASSASIELRTSVNTTVEEIRKHTRSLSLNLVNPSELTPLGEALLRYSELLSEPSSRKVCDGILFFREELIDILDLWFTIAVGKGAIRKSDTPEAVIFIAVSLCGRFRYRPVQMMPGFLKLIREYIARFNVKQFKTLLSAASKVLLQDHKLISAIRRHFIRLGRPASCAPNYIWAMAILKGGNPEQLTRSELSLFSCLKVPEPLSNASAEIYGTMLRHAELYLYPHLSIPASWRQLIRRAEKTRSSSRPKLNSFEHQVLQNLKDSGYKCSTQTLHEGYWIDIVATAGDVVLAVECYGDQYHFVANGNYPILDGQGRMREYILEKGGYVVVRILSSQFPDDKEEQTKYIKQQIQLATVNP